MRVSLFAIKTIINQCSWIKNFKPYAPGDVKEPTQLLKIVGHVVPELWSGLVSRVGALHRVTLLHLSLL